MKALAVLGGGSFTADVAAALESRGFEVLCLPAADYLAAPVSAHADMLMLQISERVFCHKRYFEGAGRQALEKLSRLRPGLEIFPVSDETGPDYPFDVRLNCALFGRYLFCSKHTSGAVADYAREKGFVPVPVKQGYTGCSTVTVGTAGIITSDSGIAEAGRGLGIPVLEVSPGNISLPGYDTGFIGGCSGTFDRQVYFCGDLSLHPDGEKIVGFCRSLGYSAMSLCGGGLKDVGSIFFI